MQITTKQRYLALDVFRGLTLALMIVVNTPGSDETSYAQLMHAAWHGFTLTDLVFPSFLFVVGTALSLSMKKFIAMSQSQFLHKVLTRGALIFVCGYLLYWFPFFTPALDLAPISHTRIPGVLQRIGVCYVLAALIVRYWKNKGALVFCVVALLAYWLLMATLGDYSMTGNAERMLDRALLGDAHLYHGEGIPFDPEGILSTLPSIVNVLAGYFAGSILQSHDERSTALKKFIVAGTLSILIALLWNDVFPINKKLWTSSFVLCTVGLDLFILTLLVYLIDIKNSRSWTYFFEVFGKNTLFIYLLADVAVIVLARIHVGDKNLYAWIYARAFQSWAGTYNASLLFALCYMLVCWGVAYAMDKKRIYIKL